MNAAEAKRWLTYARSDLDAAQTLLQTSESYFRQVCFFAQQAAEKALKAILIFLETDFPYTHDLDHLREIVPPGWRVKTTYPKLYGLSIWAVEARYPGDLPDVVESEAQQALQTANAIYQMIVEDIEKEIKNMSNKLEKYKNADFPIPEKNHLWPLYGRDSKILVLTASPLRRRYQSTPLMNCWYATTLVGTASPTSK